MWEEAAPVDSEFRREAEIIRQVREENVEVERPSTTAQSSPSLLPAVPGLDGPLEGVPEEETDSNLSLDSLTTKGLFGAFGTARMNGSSFWQRDTPAQTPPPPPFPRAGSSAMSEDISMDSPLVASTSTSLPGHTSTVSDPSNSSGYLSRSSTPQPLAPLTAADGLKKSSKRRRDDDLDGYSIKRRAVSPGVSVHNSPVLSQSPANRDGGLWGTTTKASREASTGGHGAGERSNSGGSMSLTPSLGPKRIGLQGMTDTHDGLMKMSIE